MFFLLVFPLPGVVHDHVSPWPLQQFFLCCSSPWHCNGIQDITNYPVFSDPQWQTGINCHVLSAFFLKEDTGKITSWLNSASLQIDNRTVLSSWIVGLGLVGKLGNGFYKHEKTWLACMTESLNFSHNFSEEMSGWDTVTLSVRGLFAKLSSLTIRNLVLKQL